MDEHIIENAIAYIAELFRANAGGHDAEHTLRVYHNAIQIAENEPDCDVQIAALAALLHDADDHKLFDTENNANARAFLSANRVPSVSPKRLPMAASTGDRYVNPCSIFMTSFSC